jgi:hypothetical protein
MRQKQVWRRLLQSCLVSSALGVAWLVSSPNTTQFATSTESPESEELPSFNEIESADDRFVEVDGLRFEVVLSDVEVGERDQFIQEVNTFQIPKEPEFQDGFSIYSPENYTTIYIALRITNSTNSSILFPRFIQIKPGLFNQNGKSVMKNTSCHTSRIFNTSEVGSVLLLPGETINLLFSGLIYWDSIDLIYDNTNQEIDPTLNYSNLTASFGTKHIAYPECFTGLQAGTIRAEFLFQNQIDQSYSEIDPCYFSLNLPCHQPFQTSLPQEVWKGSISLPGIEFQLID